MTATLAGLNLATELIIQPNYSNGDLVSSKLSKIEHAMISVGDVTGGTAMPTVSISGRNVTLGKGSGGWSGTAYVTLWGRL